MGMETARKLQYGTITSTFNAKKYNIKKSFFSVVIVRDVTPHYEVILQCDGNVVALDQMHLSKIISASDDRSKYQNSHCWSV